MGFMSPSTPKPPEPVKVPTLSDAEVSSASEDEKQRRRGQRGRASTLLSSDAVLGDDSAGGTSSTGSGLATKTLLGG